MGWISDKLEKGDYITIDALHERFSFTDCIGVGIAGKTSLVGPVCVASLRLHPGHKLNIKPLQSLNERDLYKINKQIRYKFDDYKIRWASVGAIFNAGLSPAIEGAIFSAVAHISIHNPVSVIFIDHPSVCRLPTGVLSSSPVFFVSKGTEVVEAIRGATAIAKIARKSIMTKLHHDYPEYDWISNHGYATQQHIEHIQTYGITPEHRDLSNVKALKDFKAFVNEKWRKKHENHY